MLLQHSMDVTFLASSVQPPDDMVTREAVGHSTALYYETSTLPSGPVVVGSGYTLCIAIISDSSCSAAEPCGTWTYSGGEIAAAAQIKLN